MTNIEKEALVFFKEYTHLQLKTFKWSREEELRNTSGGAMEDYDMSVLNQALEYHVIYTSLKLNKNRIKNAASN